MFVPLVRSGRFGEEAQGRPVPDGVVPPRAGAERGDTLPVRHPAVAHPACPVCEAAHGNPNRTPLTGEERDATPDRRHWVNRVWAQAGTPAPELIADLAQHPYRCKDWLYTRLTPPSPVKRQTFARWLANGGTLPATGVINR